MTALAVAPDAQPEPAHRCIDCLADLPASSPGKCAACEARDRWFGLGWPGPVHFFFPDHRPPRRRADVDYHGGRIE